jgi:hypothetical protein
MKLAEFQRRMAADVMRPLTAAESSEPDYVKPNDRLTATERLAIYNRGYCYRLLDSLREDFPRLRKLLGEPAFTSLSEAYLTDCPSTSYTLARLGSKLEAWLRRNPQWAGDNFDLTLDMVRLEWAHLEAFDGASRREIGPEDLAEFSPALKIHLQPHVRLLDLQYPVHEKSHKKRLKKAPLYLAVHRSDGYVYYRPLELMEFGLLKSIRRGGRLSTIVRNQPVSAHQLQQWFAAWSRLGWLCH